MGDADHEPLPENLKKFNKRLRRARQAIEAPEREVAGTSKGTAYNLGLRIAADLVVAVLAGLVIGWGLDELLGTKPWFLLVFIPLGMAAGILNVMRLARSDEVRRHMEQMSSGPARPSERIKDEEIEDEEDDD